MTAPFPNGSSALPTLAVAAILLSALPGVEAWAAIGSTEIELKLGVIRLWPEASAGRIRSGDPHQARHPPASFIDRAADPHHGFIFALTTVLI